MLFEERWTHPLARPTVMLPVLLAALPRLALRGRIRLSSLSITHSDPRIKVGLTESTSLTLNLSRWLPRLTSELRD